MLGEPVTKTASSNTTRTSIPEPAPYVPSAFAEETDRTRGASVSMAMLREAPSEPGAPGAGSFAFASLPAASRIMDPPLRARASIPA